MSKSSVVYFSQMVYCRKKRQNLFKRHPWESCRFLSMLNIAVLKIWHTGVQKVMQHCVIETKYEHRKWFLLERQFFFVYLKNCVHWYPQNIGSGAFLPVMERNVIHRGCSFWRDNLLSVLNKRYRGVQET